MRKKRRKEKMKRKKHRKYSTVANDELTKF